jgi:hypothetical protein
MGFSAYALLTEARAAVPQDRRMAPRIWLNRQDELARGLAGGSISQVQWHDGVNAFAGEVDVAALAALIRGAQLRDAGAPFGHDPQKRFVRFLDEQRQPQRFAYVTALFSFTRDSVITPHAHKHMASAHKVLDGKVRIRTFDRVADSDTTITVRPTLDTVADVGHAAAMTTAKDNVHWFTAASANAMTFDVIIDSLDAGQESYLIQPVDVLGGTHRADGSIEAPIMSFDASSARYTAAL